MIGLQRGFIGVVGGRHLFVGQTGTDQQMSIVGFVDLLSPIAGLSDVLGLIFFIVFFAITATAFYFRDRYRIRQFYIGIFIVCLVSVNVVGIAVLPMTHWQKFGSEGPEETVIYDVRVADEPGNEIHYDPRAAPPLTGSTLNRFGDRLVNDCDPELRDQTAKHMLEKAHEYRSMVESEPIVRPDRYQFPRHNLDYRWSGAELEPIGEFRSLRIYEISVTFDEGGTEFDQYSESLVYEYEATDDDLSTQFDGEVRAC